MTTNTKIGIVAGAVAVALLGVVAMTATANASPAVSATAAVFSALAAVVTASISTATLAQLRRDSRATTRPQVGAWLRPGGVRGYVDLVLKNFGESIAHDVRVELVGLPEWTKTDAVLSNIWKRYEAPISALVPDLELSNTYTARPDIPAPQPPAQVTVNVSYADDEGRRYSDQFDLDVGLIWTETWSQQSEG